MPAHLASSLLSPLRFHNLFLLALLALLYVDGIDGSALSAHQLPVQKWNRTTYVFCTVLVFLRLVGRGVTANPEVLWD